MKTTLAQAGKYIAMLSLLLFSSFSNLFAGNVLVYGPLLAFNEDAIATSLGHTVTIVDTIQWKNMTTSQFAAYDAIIIPEHGWASNNTGNNDPNVRVLNNTKAVWSPAITGTRVYISYDPLLDGGSIGLARVSSGIDSAATQGGTGLYFATSLLFFYSPPSDVVIDFLSLVDSIRVKGGTCLEATFTYYPSYFTKTDSCIDGTPLKIVSLPSFYMPTPNPRYFCSGNSFNLNFYNTRDTFLTGNVFTVELSDASGDFSSPTILGTLAGTTSGSIPITIPNGLPSGSGYRMRLTSSMPYKIADGGNVDLLINTNQNWYLDADHDHYYTGSAINQCNSPGAGYVTSGFYRGNDYDDNNPAIHATPANLLIYGPRLRVTTPNERTLAIAQGHTVTVVNDAQWSAMSTAQFASYDAIIIPDDNCSSNNGNLDFTVLNSTKAIWSPAITGRRCYIATDPIADNTPRVSINAINFVSEVGRTGLLVNTSCSFVSNTNFLPIDFLSLLDSVTIRQNAVFSGTNLVEQTSHPVMDEMTKDSLFGEHSYFGYHPFTLQNLFSVDGHPVILATPDAPIFLNSISRDYLCDGNSFDIQYFISGTYNTGNIFTAQLSDATGSFASPVDIGSLASTNFGSITATIPSSTPAGAGYRIRIVSSSPVRISGDNLVDLHININRNWYLDADNDQYYTGNLVNQCDSPGVGYTTTGILGGNDCDDSDPQLHDGNRVWYLDADNDHYYTGSGITQCHSPGSGYNFEGFIGGLDCDDNNATINPGLVEIIGNGSDDNCNGLLNENNALNFDGANDSIVAPFSPNQSLNPTYSYVTQTIALTISAWIKLDVGSMTQKIVSRTSSYTLEVNSSNQLQYRSGAYDANDPARFGQIPIGVWTHVAIVVLNNSYTRTITFYINGQNVGSSTSTYRAYITTSGSDLFIGPNFHGKIDELTIWNQVRSQSEIQADLCGVSCPDANLIAHYSFNQGIPNSNNSGLITLVDNSGRNNNGTLQNFALTGSASNWSDSYIIYEDLDNDGYGSTNTATCGVANNTDCDDNDPAVHDGTVVWYLDADGDHYSIGSSTTACHSPGAGYTNNGIIGGDDCDDSNPSVHDGATMWYMDADGDHYVTGQPIQSCLSPGTGYTFTGILGYDDCDDADPSVFYDYQSWVLDADGDHFYVNEVSQCSSPGAGYVKQIGVYYANDCNDNDANINAGAIEIPGNGIDENCNGVIDEVLPCYPTIDFPYSGYCISNVSLGTIFNSTGCELTHYGAYINLSTIITPGSTQTIHLGSSAQSSRFSIYIDWNDNLILGDDPLELVGDNIAVEPVGNGGTDFSFTVPSTVPFGNHIMRIISEYGNYTISNPCFTSYGEVEDYTVTVGSCIPTVDYICQGLAYLSNVTIGTLNNNSNCDGVTDYSSTLACTALQGSTINYSISVSSYYGAEASIGIYIDYNNDGDFYDVDEQVLPFGYAQAYLTDVTGTFTIPALQPSGAYRIRVISEYGNTGTSNPCHSEYGEIEDYTLYVVPVLYCEPAITYPCNYDWLSNVQLGTINKTTTCSNGYNDYSFSNSTSVQAGEPLNYSLMIENPYYNNASIYIDYNTDGDFDDIGEEVVSIPYANYMAPTTGTFAIPGNTPAGNYRIRVRSGNEYLLGACDNSTYGEVEDYSLTVTALDVCPPIVDIPCTNQWISHVTFGSIDNASDCYGGYANYASTLSTSLAVAEPLYYTIEVGGYSLQQVNIFIDFNDDGDFDDTDEHVITNAYANQTNNSPSGYFYLPSGLTAGNYRVRIMTDTYNYTSSDVDPCHILDGEVEDYMINVLFPKWYRDFDGDYYGDPSIFVHAEFNPVGYVSDNTDCDDNNALAHPNASEIAGNLVDDNCNGVVDELYCIPSGATNHCYNMWINRVVIGSIDNSTSCTTNGYSDFSSTQSTSHLPNSNVSFDIYGYGNEQKVSIYIDYNSDFDFDDAGEEVAFELYMSNNLAPASGTFTIPSSIAAGNYRMRVISEFIYINDLTFCTTYLGETEDYTLTVVTSCTDPSVPTISSTSTSNCGAQSTTLSISTGSLNDATNWKWYSGNCGGTFAGTGASLVVSPSSTTTYFVRGEGGCVSNGMCASLTINVNTPQTWYEDGDGDSYGNAAVSVTDCSAHPGYVLNNTDCDDILSAINPGVTEICSNGIDDNCNGQTDEGCALLINLKVFIQGYYLGGGMMSAVIDPINNPTLCDTLILQLANPNSPYQIQYSDTAILHTDGSIQFEFPIGLTGNYYFVLRHRNAIETWSATSQSISSGMFYDFTDIFNRSLGDNMINLDLGVYGLYSGDISNNANQTVQDGIINSSDLGQMEISFDQMLSGYYKSDLTGDNMIESSDYSLIENNQQLNIIVHRP